MIPPCVTSVLPPCITCATPMRHKCATPMRHNCATPVRHKCATPVHHVCYPHASQVCYPHVSLVCYPHVSQACNPNASQACHPRASQPLATTITKRTKKIYMTVQWLKKELSIPQLPHNPLVQKGCLCLVTLLYTYFSKDKNSFHLPALLCIHVHQSV